MDLKVGEIMKIVKWIVSVLLAIWGMFHFLSVVRLNGLYAIAGILTLAVAVLLCPALDEKLKNFKYKSAVIAILVIAILVVYYFVGTSM